MNDVTAQVDLAAPTTLEPGWVVRKGKIFEAGTYFEDKKFGLSEEEARAAIADFTPVPIDSEHQESVFDGKLGQVVALRLDEDGKTLQGDVLVPAWLDSLFKDVALPVSATWDRATKRLKKLALAKTPRISDAAIFAAFSAAEQHGDIETMVEFAKRHDTSSGQTALQRIHDLTVQHGAVCKANGGDATMASRHENAAIQRVHDEAVAHGASCESIGGRQDVMPLPWYSGKAPARTSSSKGKTRMDRNKVLAWLFGTTEDAEGAADFTAAFESDEIAKKAADGDKKLQAEFASALKARDDEALRLRNEVAAMKAERIVAKAEATAERLISAGHALPAEREALIVAFTQSLTDDSEHGAVTFSDGTPATSRTDMLIKVFELRVPHTLTQEHIQTAPATEGATPTPATFSLPNAQHTPRAGDEKPVSEERRLQLLKMTPTGRKAAEALAK